ncbi:MAG: SDR family NAD(P)-dependent oxidoreductase [Bacteroidetes bacterium]|nr:MAG: SDR family NAD(P)-dependent oxidoreductase [Bacteroidota bacterium]
MEKVLVAGATGYLGQHLVKELKNRGYWVRVLIRKESQKLLFEDIDEFFLGEVTKKETIYGICENIDLIFSSIGITRQKDGLTYMDVDFQGNKNLLVEAQKSKVKAFQYISALNGDKLRHLKIAEAKERFVDELKNSGMQFTIMRPNGFFSDMADFLNMAKGGRVYLFGNGNHKINPIHGADLAKVCVNSIETGNKEVEVGGPEIYTQNEIAQLALKAWNKKVKIIHLPDWIRKLTIWTIRTFTTQKTYGPIEFFLTAMALDNVAPKYGKRKLEDFFNKEVKK